MTDLSTSLLTLAVLLAMVNWWAVARDSSRLEYFTKPSTTLALLAAASALDVVRDARWGLLLAALVFCTIGDVLLMLPRDSFLPGLAAFAVAQLLFVVSFFAGSVELGRLAIGSACVIPLALSLSRRYVGALRRSNRSELVIPVVVYVIVISSMVIAATSAGSPVGIGGAASFMISDSLIAETRFVKARTWHAVVIMVTYHAALTGLVLGLL